MTRRRIPLALLQLAAFVGGGLLAPVVHLAGHRPDHSHGTDGRTLTFHVASLAPPTVERREEPDRGGIGRHGHPHSHPHSHSHAHSPSEEDHTPVAPDSETRQGPSDATTLAGPDADAQPLETTHGHGSLAHLGLALLSAPPPLPLPTPRLTAVLVPPAPGHVEALFHPTFPLPRPPPVALSS